MLPPCGLELALQDGLGFSVQHGVHSLFQLAACLGESARFLVARDATVGGTPLQDQSRFGAQRF